MSEGKKPRVYNPNLTNCKYFRKGQVMCDQNVKLYSGHCEKCGWNPFVKQQRLEKMYGRKLASEAIIYSQSITDNMNGEYNLKWKDYKPRKEEP